MRLRASRSAPFLLLGTCFPFVACSDDRPVYPPIVINVVGSGATGTGATGNETSSGDQTGSGDVSNGGSGTAGGSGSTGGNSNAPPSVCTNFWGGQDPPVKTKCDLDHLEDGGELSGDVDSDTTWKGGKSYTLKGIVRVMAGKTLTIEPCTVIKGYDASAALVVRSGPLGDDICSYDSGKPSPGGKLMAVGEPMAPIIFTSNKPKGKRKKSDWGGVLLLGNAHVNNVEPNTRIAAEGLIQTECYGWHTDEFDAESSGRLEYVRIEFASQRVSSDLETNGLTLGGVGSGTTLRYLQVTNSGDDCFEWFGGTVNADHLVAYNCEDDMFDIDTGYSGHLQFLFGRGDTGVSTEETSYAYEVTQGPTSGQIKFPTSAQISNATQCGSGSLCERYWKTRSCRAFRRPPVNAGCTY